MHFLRKVWSIYKYCHTVSPEATMSRREEELPLQMTENSYQNIMIFFILNTHKASRMDYLSLIASQSVTVSSALLWLLTGRHFWENQQRENSSSSWQVGLFANYLFPSIRHTGEFTCICSTMLDCSPASNIASLCLERMSQILQIFK